ncbi:MAG: hypothetical protein U9M91_05385 [Chloroflexota bacterium]|nr:hypothetical protein [Chloroflexota bacterium]
MKLSKKVGLIVVIVVIVAALAGLFTIYSRQAGERGELEDGLSRAETLLPTLINQRDSLEKELAQAESSLDTSQTKFPRVVESIEYSEDFFKIADDCNLDLTRLTASKPTNKKVGTITYSVSSFAVVVEGNTDNILKFIDAVGTGIDYDLSWSFQLPWSVEVKSINMEVGKSRATISLNIYGYKGT